MRDCSAFRLTIFSLSLILMLFGIEQLPAQKKGYAQGYIVTLEGDTVKGAVKDRSGEPFENLYSKIRFKKNGRLKKKFRPDQIRGYGYAKSHFEAVQVEELSSFFRFEYRSNSRAEPVFLKVVRRSPNLVLYEWEYVQDDSSYLESFPLFFRTDTEVWVRATQGIFGLKRKKLTPFFKDCPKLVQGLSDKSLNNVYEILEVWEDNCGISRP